MLLLLLWLNLSEHALPLLWSSFCCFHHCCKLRRHFLFIFFSLLLPLSPNTKRAFFLFTILEWERLVQNAFATFCSFCPWEQNGWKGVLSIQAYECGIKKNARISHSGNSHSRIVNKKTRSKSRAFNLYCTFCPSSHYKKPSWFPVSKGVASQGNMLVFT